MPDLNSVSLYLKKADRMHLPRKLRIQVADQVARFWSYFILVTMSITIISTWLLGEHQYYRMIPALIAMVLIIPGLILAHKGRPLIGVWFVIASIVGGILSGMVLSGGIKALSYLATLFCVTPIVVLYGLRGGVVFTGFVICLGLLFVKLDEWGLIEKAQDPPAVFFISILSIYMAIQIYYVWMLTRLMLKALFESDLRSRELKVSVEKLQLTEVDQRETKRVLEEIQAVSKIGGWEYHPASHRITWTDEVYRIFGKDTSQGPLEADQAIEYFIPEHRKAVEQAFRRAVEQGESYDLELELIRTDGARMWVRTMGQPVFDEGRVVRVSGNIIDITERRRAENEHQESEERYRSLVENTADGHFICEIPSGRFIFLNQPICKLLGYSMQEAMALSLWDAIDPVEHGRINSQIREILDSNTLVHENHISNALRKDGSKFRAEISISIVIYKGAKVLQGSLKDITEREGLLLQLQQAQKMEAIGQLAGGVAHDYNNMLSVILGYTELTFDDVRPGDPLYDNILEIQNAANRSRSITRQLLAFARKETIVPEVLDLNTTIEGMLKMIRRLIGEDIDFVWHPKAEIWPIKMDPSQIDQILANLCLNARDAIAGVGKITIQTSTATFDEDYCTGHAGFLPGDFVLMEVADDGAGMDAQTIEKIFEPFFTTKGTGKGTGLGMATVYGIVKQNEGFIKIESEPGKGSTFKIYLPRYSGEPTGEKKESADEIPYGSGETLLVVEDEISTLKLLEKLLTKLNYRCLLAGTPTEALTLAEAHADDISLLMTDVIMPEMNGRELSEHIKSRSPRIKCLFMSGYTANEIDDRGVLEAGVNFIHKPFTQKSLAVKIKTALKEV